MNGGLVRVMIVDDSAVVRQVLSESLDRMAGFEVVAQVMDPVFAWMRLEKTAPDVILCGLDPARGGLAFLERLAAERPTPVVMLESNPGQALTLPGVAATLPKPASDVRNGLMHGLDAIAGALRIAAARPALASARPVAQSPPKPSLSTPAPPPTPAVAHARPVPSRNLAAKAPHATTRVMIVDDSAVVRQVLSGLLSKAVDIEVIGQAMDPIFAMEKMRVHWPDVVILDVEMPRMDGITFLRQIMAERPTPVIICSSLTGKGAETTMQALAAGAFAIFTKPGMGVKGFLEDAAEELIAEVRAAAQARVGRILDADPVPQRLSTDTVLTMGSTSMAETTDRITVIGTSTGGTQALEYVLTALPVTCPGIAVVQHMPEAFTAAFAERLDKICAITVREAKNGDRILPGHALIAPGGKHLVIKRSGAQYRVEVVSAPPVNRHCPSVDVLFRSAAKYAGRNATGVIMTGMGDDGARGLLEMHEAGARTLAQDEASCVVFGMPKEAIRLGGVDVILPLKGIPAQISR